MKLLYCHSCADVFNLKSEYEKKCCCGKTSGEYIYSFMTSEKKKKDYKSEFISEVLGVLIIILVGIILFLGINGFITQDREWRVWRANKDLAGCRKVFGEHYNLIYHFDLLGLYEFPFCASKNDTQHLALPDYY